MNHPPAVMNAVESLDYRVTVGDVAAATGLDLNTAQRGLLALATDTQAHLQVSEAGEIAYEFPKSFRTILRNKYWQIRVQAFASRIWQVLFYIIRISFGLVLITSLVLIVLALIALSIAASMAQQGDRDNGWGRDGDMVFIPHFWLDDLFWFFHFDYGRDRSARPRSTKGDEQGMNFLEAVFSFLFGDGDPNADFEERRWRTIGAVIQNHGGAITAEQLVPYLDNVGKHWSMDFGNEDYMVPVLSRFNGTPQVSPQGEIVYHFPELQVKARDRNPVPVAAYLKEKMYTFSRAKGGQITAAIGLGIANFAGAIALGVMLQDHTLVAAAGSLVAFVNGIYWLLLGYGTSFLGVPAGRFLWLKRLNQKITERNTQRQERAIAVNEMGDSLREKLAFAQQFAAQSIVSADDLAYTTEKDLTEQEYEQREKLDAEWLERLQPPSTSP